jgi:hypothetical protein
LEGVNEWWTTPRREAAASQAVFRVDIVGSCPRRGTISSCEIEWKSLSSLPMQTVSGT